jgi:3',5'-cyclic AMP phosphodiesterase CpdA
MKIQIVSDLHLEFYSKDTFNLITPAAPILCLVGDICVCGDPVDFQKLLSFLRHFSPKFEAIVHVAGNHEYYTKSRAGPAELITNTIPEIDKKLRALTKTIPNYHYLNNSTWTYKNDMREIVFIGTTLWTHIPAVSKSATADASKGTATQKKTRSTIAELIQARMNDYNFIYVPARINGKASYRQYTVVDMQKKHNAAVAFLKQAYCAAKKVCAAAMSAKKTPPTFILLTHHKPLFDKSTDLTNIYTYAYENDLAAQLLVSPISLAAHGHTHKHYDKKINGVRVVSNPKGYIGEHTSYVDKFVVSV